MARGTFRSDDACRAWWGKVSTAAEAFERRWTLLHLRRVDNELATMLMQQRDLFDRACLVGTVGDIEMQGAAMCRGWLAAIKRMEDSGEADSAYLLGRDPVSGLTVAIGHNKAAADRIVELYQGEAIHLTPDEVATMMAAVEAFKSIGAVKQKFPGAEIIRYGASGT